MGALKRAPSHECLDYYLDERAFGFNRRKSNSRGKLFFRLVQQALETSAIARESLKAKKSNRSIALMTLMKKT
jgi:hypothetical protein